MFAVLSDSNHPVIGITTYRQQAKTGVWDVDAAFLHSGYIDSVTRAGGIAVLLPPQPASIDIVERVLDGSLEIDHYITHTFKGVENTNDAFDALHSGSCLRAVVIY